MKVAQSGQNYLAISGINPSQSLFNVKSFVTTFIYTTNVGGNLAFLFYEANTLFEYSNSIFTTSVAALDIICFIIFASKKSLIFRIINSFEEIIEKRTKTPAMRSVYDKTNRVAEKWSKLVFLLLVKLTPVGLVFPKAIFIYLIYYTTDAGRDAFNLPYLMWFPFDWRTPIGYFFAVIIQYLQAFYILLITTFVISIELGCFLMLNTILKDLCASINSFNDNAHFDGNRMQIIEQLSDFIETHSLVLELIDAFLSLIKHAAIVFFAWQCIVSCVSLLLIQMEISKVEIDYVALLQTITTAYVAFFVAAVACEAGERLSELFSAVDETMDEIDWYLYPIEIKRMLPAIMIVTQKPIYVELFGSITASRETFKRVMKGGWSVFTVLREFT